MFTFDGTLLKLTQHRDNMISIYIKFKDQNLRNLSSFGPPFPSGS